ncbi:hypothetical protein KIP76_24180, partial [Pseudomonas aeruginosa]
MQVFRETGDSGCSTRPTRPTSASPAEHPRAEWNDLWLLSEVFHEGKQPQVLEENVTSDTSA